MTDPPDCELTRRINNAIHECNHGARFAIREELRAALGLLAHARIDNVPVMSGTFGERVLVVPLAQEPYLYATDDDDGRPLMGDLGV